MLMILLCYSRGRSIALFRIRYKCNKIWLDKNLQSLNIISCLFCVEWSEHFFRCSLSSSFIFISNLFNKFFDMITYKESPFLKLKWKPQVTLLLFLVHCETMEKEIWKQIWLISLILIIYSIFKIFLYTNFITKRYCLLRKTQMITLEPNYQ